MSQITGVEVEDIVISVLTYCIVAVVNKDLNLSNFLWLCCWVLRQISNTWKQFLPI